MTSLNLTENKKRPAYIILTILALVIGLSFDFLYFNEPLISAYVPFMIMVGFMFRSYLTSLFLSGLLVGLLYLASSYGWGFELLLLRWLILFIVPSVIQTLLKNMKKERENLINLTAVLAESLDARDKYTSYHSKNVAYYSSEIGKGMGLPTKICEILYVGGLLHDVGKIGVPEAILNKPSKLTDEEFEKIKQHPSIGYNMLKHIPDFRKNSILDIVLHHHERFDGKGYPARLKGEEIPLGARITAIADAFDAMTSRRIYRDDKGLEYALNELTNGENTQFDPEITKTFLSLIQAKKIIVRGHQD
ncbi:HD-GYP domain-containing protein [Evansella tamaricis]|uniref:HD-GYP domain-containing protein n=1 Tax=Evansella tamaricis TaxID=2069301 RepID=A0ABS6JFI2_9BACI|nr:HD-GYP domain-containing protein [Evansella tamaricis]MBU9711577.1 HD-GYP domain-containing protein [Evansella tamaricis]